MSFKSINRVDSSLILSCLLVEENDFELYFMALKVDYHQVKKTEWLLIV